MSKTHEDRTRLVAEPKLVQEYYRDKTQPIIERYGPGPRIHYHIGLFDIDPLEQQDRRYGASGTSTQIRARIVAAQERLLDRAASAWGASAAFSGGLLDVGCGLGGGSIYWAQHFPVQVTALTNVPEQADATRHFAEVAGVFDRVRTLVTDARGVMPIGRYSAAVAVESSCYVPREQLFQRIAASLKPGGVFGIEDIFLAQEDWRAPFDYYWKTRIGTVREYEKAAAGAGMVLEQDADITEATSAFWLFSMSWAQARLAEPADGADQVKLARSIRWHRRFFRGWNDGAYEAHILRFRKPR